MTVTIVETRAVTGGVDTHAEVHVAAALDPVGGLLGVEEFPAIPAGYARLLAWLGGFGTVCLVGVEGTGSYGAGLARHLGRRAQFLDGQLERLDELIVPLVTARAPGLLSLYGAGPGTAAKLLIAAGTTPGGCGPRPLGPTCAPPRRSPPPPARSNATASTLMTMAAQVHAGPGQPVVLAHQVGGQVMHGPAGMSGRPHPVTVIQILQQRDGSL